MSMTNLRNELYIIKGMSNYTRYELKSLKPGYPAILYKEPNEYGVAFPFNDNREIKYKFVNIILETKYIDSQKILYLHSKNIVDIDKFVLIAENFLDENNRDYILSDPYKWADEWKDTFGNSKRKLLVSDLIAELIVYEILIKEDKNVSWGASEKTTHDFEMLEKSVEVKSTTNKTNTLISVNSSYQLSGSKPVFIYFVRLEKVKFKNSINSCVEKIVSLGIPRDALEAELSKLGYPKGVKERDDSFDLLEIRSYVVEESNFPKIDLNDLNNLIGVKNIVAYKFELDLSNVPYKKII